MAKAVFITGSNFGDREKNIADARRLLGERTGRIIAVSTVMESEPWGEVERGGGAGDFLNQVIVVDTVLAPDELLDLTQDIERELGRESAGKTTIREKERRYQSRTMDIDILFYGDETLSSQRLTIPHPMIPRRGFVLRPLAEVMPQYVHPLYGLTVAELWGRLADEENN